VDENEMRVAVKRVKAGKGSTFITSIYKPATKWSDDPDGNFHSQMDASHKIEKYEL